MVTKKVRKDCTVVNGILADAGKKKILPQNYDIEVEDVLSDSEDEKDDRLSMFEFHVMVLFDT